MNFQPILDCFIPKFKLEYDNLENINIVIFNLHQIKHLKSFGGHPVLSSYLEIFLYTMFSIVYYKIEAKVLQNVKFVFSSRGLWPDLSLPFGRKCQFCCQDTFKSSRADHSPSFKQ